MTTNQWLIIILIITINSLIALVGVHVWDQIQTQRKLYAQENVKQPAIVTRKYTDTVTRQVNDGTPYTLTYYCILLKISTRQNPIAIDSLDPTLYNQVSEGQRVFYWNGTITT